MSEGHPSRILARAVEALEMSQWKTPEAIAAVQRKQLVQLARHCESHSGHFRNRLREAGATPDGLGEAGGLQRLPILSRRVLQSATGPFYAAVPDLAERCPLVTMTWRGSKSLPAAN